MSPATFTFNPQAVPDTADTVHIFQYEGLQRVLPAASGEVKSLVGDFQAEGEVAGGPQAATGLITPDELAAYPGIYKMGATWLVKDTRTGEYVFGGELNDPETSEGTVRLSAVGWGARSDKFVPRMMFQSQDVGRFVAGSVLGYDDDEQIQAEVKGMRLVFRIPRLTSFRRNKAGVPPHGWSSGLYMWIPRTDLRYIAFDVTKRKGDARYDLLIVAAKEAGDPLKTIHTQSMDGGLTESVSVQIPAGYSVVGVKCRRTEGTKQTTQGRRFVLTNVRVGGIATTDVYTVGDGLAEIMGRLGADTTSIGPSSFNILPYDAEKVTLGELADEMALWESFFWRLYPDADGAKHGEAAKFGNRKWVLANPKFPVRLLPAERYSHVQYECLKMATEITKVKAATNYATLFPDGFQATYKLSLEDTPPEAPADVFAQVVADYLATHRSTGSATFSEVEDPAFPGVAVPASRVRPGDGLVLSNHGGIEVVVSKVRFNSSTHIVEAELADGNPLLDRILALRRRLLHIGKAAGYATLGALGPEEPAVPTNLTMAFKEVEKADGRRVFHAIVDFDPVVEDVDGAGTAIREYHVWMRPRNSSGNVVPDENGGGWRKQVLRETKDLDLPEDIPTKALFRRLEKPKKWSWEAKARSEDYIGQQSAWSPLTPAAKPASFGPKRPQNVIIDVDAKTQVVDWEAPERTNFSVDPATDVLTAVSHDFGSGDRVEFDTTGTAPGGLVAKTVYYVRDATTDTLKLATTLGGVAINITSAGSGEMWLGELDDEAVPVLDRSIHHFRCRLYKNGVLVKAKNTKGTRVVFRRPNPVGTKFKAEVKSVDDYGNSSIWVPSVKGELGDEVVGESGTVTASTPPAPTDKPTIILLYEPKRVKVLWNYTPTPEQPVDHYVIRLNRDKDADYAGETWKDTNFEDVGLSETVFSEGILLNKYYRARYKVVDALGVHSDWSDWSKSKKMT